MGSSSGKKTGTGSSKSSDEKTDTTASSAEMKQTEAKQTATSSDNKNDAIKDSPASPTRSPKLKLILKVPKTPVNTKHGVRDVSSAPAGRVKSSTSSKRSSLDAELSDAEPDADSDTDSDIDITPAPARKVKKPVSVSKKTAVGKKRKTKTADFEIPEDHPRTDRPHTVVDVNHNYFSDSKSESVSHDEPTKGEPSKDIEMTDPEDSTEPTGSDEELELWLPKMKRSKRIVNPNDPDDAALIAEAIEEGKKAGEEIYDSDAEEAKDELTNMRKPQLFRNVVWGNAAYDTDGDDFEMSRFIQFVPGRWERMPDGTVEDQKRKLCINLIDHKGVRRIFKNPPPKDWSNQEALTILNKRIVQQIRRNTNVRFRANVTPYTQDERGWILANLNKEGKPRKGWKRFVAEFNDNFSGKNVDGKDRPERSHSSLTKEVERFSEQYYKQGKIPEPVKDADKRKVGAAKRKAENSKEASRKKRKTI